MCGGVIGLAGSMVLGARIGKFRKDGRPNAMPSHNIPMVMLGTFILAFGWFGFNPGATLSGTDGRIAVIAVNTMLAGAAASLATTVLVWNWFGKPDPSMMCNGLLAGLVAITAPCAFVTPVGAIMIGAIAGIIVVVSVVFIERTLRVDDPVGAISVHGVCGAWGVLSVGLFANGSYGAGWAGIHTLVKGSEITHVINDAAPATLEAYNKLLAAGWTDQGVTGIFGKLFGGAYNDWSQLGAQIVGTVTCFVFIFAFAFVWFKISNLFVPIRSKAEDEVAGLDVPETGAEAYPDFHITDRTTPGR
jgi:Amt family ammonium transporter